MGNAKSKAERKDRGQHSRSNRGDPGAPQQAETGSASPSSALDVDGDEVVHNFAALRSVGLPRPPLAEDVVSAVRTFARLVHRLEGDGDQRLRPEEACGDEGSRIGGINGDEVSLMTMAEYLSRPSLQDRLKVVQERTLQLKLAVDRYRGIPVDEQKEELTLRRHTDEVIRKTSHPELLPEADGSAESLPQSGEAEEHTAKSEATNQPVPDGDREGDRKADTNTDANTDTNTDTEGADTPQDSTTADLAENDVAAPAAESTTAKDKEELDGDSGASESWDVDGKENIRVQAVAEFRRLADIVREATGYDLS